MKCITALLALILALGTILTACRGAAEPTEATQMENIYQKSDPSQDDSLNILMIGNSLCYYYVEELYGMLKAAGIKANVCNIYYSGCTIQQHWTWWKNGESNYDFFVTNENGRVKTAGTNLEWCLQQQNWDVISLQEASGGVLKTTAQQHLADNLCGCAAGQGISRPEGLVVITADDFQRGNHANGFFVGDLAVIRVVRSTGADRDQ